VCVASFTDAATAAGRVELMLQQFTMVLGAAFAGREPIREAMTPTGDAMGDRGCTICERRGVPGGPNGAAIPADLR
jgi:hypothetical protein